MNFPRNANPFIEWVCYIWPVSGVCRCPVGFLTSVSVMQVPAGTLLSVGGMQALACTLIGARCMQLSCGYSEQCQGYAEIVWPTELSSRRFPRCVIWAISAIVCEPLKEGYFIFIFINAVQVTDWTKTKILGRTIQQLTVFFILFTAFSTSTR